MSGSAPAKVAELAYEHDERGNLLAYGPACLVCGKPVVQPSKGGRPARTARPPKRVHAGCEAERDRRIKQAFAPESAIASSSAAPAAERPKQFVKQCTVRDAQTGSCCKLLAPHDGHPHRTERGVFSEVLATGETPRILAQIAVASVQRESPHGAEKKQTPKNSASPARGGKGTE